MRRVPLRGSTAALYGGVAGTKRPAAAFERDRSTEGASACPG
jgi:hypothetical protein